MNLFNIAERALNRPLLIHPDKAAILYPDADRIAARLAATAPARCRLRAISISAVSAPVYGTDLIVGSGVTFGGIYIYGDSYHG